MDVMDRLQRAARERDEAKEVYREALFASVEAVGYQATATALGVSRNSVRESLLRAGKPPQLPSRTRPKQEPSGDRRARLSGPPEERFVARVGESYGDGCTPWNGCKDKHGYGKFGVASDEVVYSHRFAYALERGPIPDGMHLHHTCGNPGCVNVEHLMPMTPEEHKRLHSQLESSVDCH